MSANPSLYVMIVFLLTIVISPTISSVLGSPSTTINNSSTYPLSNLSSTTPSTAQEEKNNKIRPSRNEDTNHVLHVYDKEWRSQRVRCVLLYMILNYYIVVY